jgi:flagellin
MALNTHRQLGINHTNQKKTTEKLSSGYRINRAADDAAGLSISEKMRAQIRGLSQASSNAQDGISLIQAAEGAMQELHAVLHRMRELAVKAANDINEAEDRNAIKSEIDQLTAEVDRIASTTEFNKKTLLDGSLSNGEKAVRTNGTNFASMKVSENTMNGYYHFAVQSAATFGQVEINVTAPVDKSSVLSIDMELLDAGNNIIRISNIRVGDFHGGENAREVGDKLVQEIIHELAVRNMTGLYAVENNNGRVTVTANHSGITTVGTAATPGMSVAMGIHNYNMPAITTTATQGANAIVEVNIPTNPPTTILVTATKDGFVYLNATGLGPAMEEANISMRIIDPTQEGLVAGINVWEGQRLTLQVGANTGTDQTIQIAVQRVSASGLGVENLQVDSHRNAQMAIDRIEAALQKVSLQRSGLGAVQNRLEHTVANLDTVGENLQEAESRIRDLDMAKEMMAFTKNNILTQAATAMLAQANQAPQSVLQLLQ